MERENTPSSADATDEIGGGWNATPSPFAMADIHEPLLRRKGGTMQVELKTENDGKAAEESYPTRASDIIEPGLTRLEQVVTIDGTEVLLKAQVKESRDRDQFLEMSILALDRKARRSSKLLLNTADIASIEHSAMAGGPNDRDVGYRSDADNCTVGTARARTAFAVVVKSLTVFNSRRKDLFILSYKGRKVTAQH